MLGLLGRLAEAGHAVVLITHSMEVAAGMADRVVVLQEGAIVAEGPPEAIAKHRQSYTGRFLRARLHLPPARRRVAD